MQEHLTPVDLEVLESALERLLAKRGIISDPFLEIREAFPKVLLACGAGECHVEILSSLMRKGPLRFSQIHNVVRFSENMVSKALTQLERRAIVRKDTQGWCLESYALQIISEGASKRGVIVILPAHQLRDRLAAKLPP